MEQLPLNLHLKIFGHLDLGDLLALRLACEKFEHIVKMVKIKELVFMKDEHFFLKCLSVRSLCNVARLRGDQPIRAPIIPRNRNRPPSRSCSMWTLFDKQVHRVPRLFLSNLKMLRIVRYYCQKGLKSMPPN